jgi:DNA mismatch endonuclease (patch repair protein)
MADIVSREKRSSMMSGIKSKNTKPEILVRSGLHRLGFRFRLHDKKLPGKPDLVLPKHSAVIFVHGCFWHGHSCYLFKLPETRKEFWQSKIEGNQKRDAATFKQLQSERWRICTIWECSLRGKGKLPADEVLSRCARWLESENHILDIRSQI